ncbi:MAG: hypothetical protein SGJ18_09620 [Pseudomonadota bacterium]|nr:hypothetical protein [Pseudomonadota bacterium]
MVLFLVFTFLQQVSFADWKWTVPEDAQVYIQPNKRSDIISDLEAGSEIMVANPTYQNQWVMIYFYFPGQPKTKGYVQRRIFKKENLEWTKNIKKKVVPTHQFGKTIGINSATSFYARGPTEIDASASETAVFGQQFGLASYPQIYFDFPFGEESSFRIYSALRKLKTQAEAELKTNGVTTLSQKMELDETFFSLGIGVRYYSAPQDSFWYGFGMEFAKGTSGTIKYDDGTIKNLSDTLPTLFIVQGTVGLDVRLTDKIYFIPTANFGAAVTSSPISYITEILLGIGWVL